MNVIYKIYKKLTNNYLLHCILEIRLYFSILNINHGGNDFFVVLILLHAMWHNDLIQDCLTQGPGLLIIYFGPHLGTVPVLELDTFSCPVPGLGKFLPIGALCLIGAPSAGTGPYFLHVLSQFYSWALGKRPFLKQDIQF